MVGVAGKFKGCNTCRTRRVKCDNQRPKCQKCIESGRECEGYERQRVFIVGTAKERGRCSSHPHRSLMTGKSKDKSAKSQKLEIEPPNPRSSSIVQIQHEFGDPRVRVSNIPANRVQCIALHTKFLTLEPIYESDGTSFSLPSLLNYLPDLAGSSEAMDFSLRSVCLIHLGTQQKDDRLIKESVRTNALAIGKVREATMKSTEATKLGTVAATMFLWLYEVVPQPRQKTQGTLSEGLKQETACTVEKSGAFKTLFGGSSLLVKQRGPASFQRFPDHHFFTRLYRNTACFDAMSRRKATFLADPAWCSTPWEHIPKNDMDRLFDIQVLLPGIFERAERLESSAPSISRRLKARDLLENCFRIDKMFEDWYNELCGRSDDPLLWHVKSTPESAFAEGSEWKARYEVDPLFGFQFEFVDVRTGFLHEYYWAALCLFYHTIQEVHRLYSEPVKFSQPQSKPLKQAPSSVPAFPTTAFDFYQTLPTNQSFDSGINQMYGPAPNQFVSNGPFQTLPVTMSQPQSQPDIFAQIPTTSFSNMDIQQDPLTSQAFNMGMSGMYTPTSQPSFQLDDASIYSNVTYPSSGTQQQSPLPYQDSTYQQFYLPPTPPSMPSSSRSATPTQAGATANSSALPPVPPLDPKFSKTSILDLANKICQGLPYTLRYTLDEFGPDHSTWPLWNALQVYRRQGSECDYQAQWCEQMTEMLKREGWAFASQMGKLSWKEYTGFDVD